jgi:hypothetical protein
MGGLQTPQHLSVGADRNGYSQWATAISRGSLLKLEQLDR